MKNLKHKALPGLLVGLITLFSTPLMASGLLVAKDSSTPLEIQNHAVGVTIEDGYAITTVENTFYNPSEQDLEAKYEFPVPENGTVAEFSVSIDGQWVIGEVVEKERAKQLYEQEKAAGRDVGMAEKVSFYRFETSVSSVRAKQQTKTRIVYMQPADVAGGIGRYVYPLEDGGTDELKQSFWQTENKVTGSFSFDLKLRSGYAVDAVRAPAHTHATISNVNQNQWSVNIGKTGSAAAQPAAPELASDTDTDSPRDTAFADLNTEEGSTASHSTLNQDVVVYWRLAPNLPGAIDLVTHREPGERRGTFMLTVTPGIDLQEITEGRDWVFVLDRSGSMSGKYQTLLDATEQALKKLTTNDRFRIILFDNSVQELTSGWVNADEISVREVGQKLQQTQVAGGTNLYAGLERAIRGLDSDRTSSIVLVTDGVANVGKTHRKDFLDLMSSHDVRLFTAVMGNGANRPMLDSMTRVSQGFTTSVSNSDDILGVLVSAIGKVKYEALHDVDLSIKGLRTSDLVPVQPTTLYRGQQMVMFGHYYGDEQAKVVLSAKISGEKKSYSSTFGFPKTSTSNPEIERLWAYAKIQDLKNQSAYLGADLEDYRSAIVDTAIEYGLVTDYTSMIVMQEQRFEEEGIKRGNRDRRLKETTSAGQRAQAPVTSRRADTNSPAFNNSRPTYSGGGSGGGAFNPLALLFFVPLLLARTRRKYASVDAS